MRNIASAALFVLAIGCSNPAPPPPPPPGRRKIDHDRIVDRSREGAGVGRVRGPRAGDCRRPEDPGLSRQADGRARPRARRARRHLFPAGADRRVHRRAQLRAERSRATPIGISRTRGVFGLEKPRVQVQGDVVFVGYGINAPELNWNDYAGANVKGKWVMIMVNDPPAPPTNRRCSAAPPSLTTAAGPTNTRKPRARARPARC